MLSKSMTAAELLCMPDGNRRHELIAGVLTTMPLNGGVHGMLVANITCPLGIYDVIDGEEVVPGWRLAVRELFG